VAIDIVSDLKAAAGFSEKNCSVKIMDLLLLLLLLLKHQLSRLEV
jgi:hypothetical protein